MQYTTLIRDKRSSAVCVYTVLIVKFILFYLFINLIELNHKNRMAKEQRDRTWTDRNS